MAASASLRCSRALASRTCARVELLLRCATHASETLLVLIRREAGRKLLTECGRPADDLSTFVLIDEEGFWTQSTAALRVAQGLGPASLGVLGNALMPLPSLVRDSVYRVVADNRYSILGRSSDDAPPSCQLRYDSLTLRERFLDYE